MYEISPSVLESDPTDWDCPFTSFGALVTQLSVEWRDLFDFVCMCSPSPKRTRLTKRECLSFLQICKSMGQLEQIHAQIFRSCLHDSRDVADGLMTFCTNPETGSLGYAEKVLLHLENPSLFLYNLMIKAFAKRGTHKQVITMYNVLREDGLLPDNFTFPFVLKAIGSSGGTLEGKVTHGFIVKVGLDFDPFVRNSLVEMYAKIGSVRDSRLLFNEMPERDVFAWNVLIAGYVKCQMFEEAISVFLNMEAEGFEPDEATLVSTLSACIPLGNLDIGRKVHGYMNGKHNSFSVVLCNALLDMYSKCGSLDIARKLFDEMPIRNVISWTTMVSGYVNCGQVDEARTLFQESPTKDVVLWTAMINGYVQFNHFDDALMMFRDMLAKRIKPDKFTVSALLTVCARLGALEHGKWLHRYIKESKMKIDTVVGTALVDMYAKCGHVEESVEVFKNIELKDTATWSAVIYGLAMNGQTSQALAFFSEMKRIGTKPDDITFVGVLSACSHGGLVDEGRHHFREMKRIYQIEPKAEHYGCLVDLFSRAGLLDETEKLIECIPSENDNDILPFLGALLAACRIHGNVCISKRVGERLANIKSCDSGLHTLLANVYAAANKWGDVMKVRREMKDLGVKKTPGCSSMEVDGIIHEFVVGDTSHPDTSKILVMLQIIRRTVEEEEIAEI